MRRGAQDFRDGRHTVRPIIPLIPSLPCRPGPHSPVFGVLAVCASVHVCDPDGQELQGRSLHPTFGRRHPPPAATLTLHRRGLGCILLSPSVSGEPLFPCSRGSRTSAFPFIPSA